MQTEVLRGAGQSEVTVYHFGAHVTSWKNAAGVEMIYTSPTAVYTGEKAIRGGIPVCFPQFGKKGPLRQHGFARISTWQLDKDYSPSSSDPAVRFILTDNDSTRASEWPHAFKAFLTVTLAADGNSLSVDMEVENKEENETFSFTTALHSYFACEAEKTDAEGLDGVMFVETSDLLNGTEPTAQQGCIKFTHPVDRVYFDTPDTLLLPFAGITLKKTNLPDAVVWNAGAKGAASLSDMPDDGWEKYVCVEPARIVEPAVLAPGQSWSCSFKMISN